MLYLMATSGLSCRHCARLPYLRRYVPNHGYHTTVTRCVSYLCPGDPSFHPSSAPSSSRRWWCWPRATSTASVIISHTTVTITLRPNPFNCLCTGGRPLFPSPLHFSSQQAVLVLGAHHVATSTASYVNVALSDPQQRLGLQVRHRCTALYGTHDASPSCHLRLDTSTAGRSAPRHSLTLRK